MVISDHILMGIALGLCEPSVDPSVIAVCIGASVFPDVDIVKGPPGSIGFLVHHRTVTHSLIFAPVFSLFLAAIVWMVMPSNASLWELWIWGWGGLVAHLLIDTLNSFGTMIFYPFSRRRVAHDLIFELDFGISGILILAIACQIVALFVAGIEPYHIGVVCTACLLIYVTLRLLDRLRFRRRVYPLLNSIDESLRATSFVPAKYWKWKGIIATKYHHYVYRLIEKQIRCEKRPIVSIPESMKIKEVMAYEQYARHLDVVIDGNRISLQNLIYSPETYKLSTEITEGDQPKIRISRPSLKPSDY